jgi:hypothetical protein
MGWLSIKLFRFHQAGIIVESRKAHAPGGPQGKADPPGLRWHRGDDGAAPPRKIPRGGSGVRRGVGPPLPPPPSSSDGRRCIDIALRISGRLLPSIPRTIALPMVIADPPPDAATVPSNSTPSDGGGAAIDSSMLLLSFLFSGEDSPTATTATFDVDDDVNAFLVMQKQKN